MKKQILLYFVILISISCKNESPFENNLYISQYIETDNVRLFVAPDKEIKDPKVIINFLKRYDPLGNYFSTNMDRVEILNDFKIQFVGTENAKVFFINDTSLRKVKTKENVIFLESNDTTNSRSYYESYYHTESDFQYNLLSYHPLYQKILPTPLGYSLLITAECYYLQVDNNKLIMPLITIIARGKPAIVNINNLLRENFVFGADLGLPDSLIVQQKRVIFTKK